MFVGDASVNLSALVAKVSVLQRQTQDIEADRVRLKEQRDFEQEERDRAAELLQATEAELAEVHARVKALTAARDEHVCAASDEQYKTLEQRTREETALRMRVARKEEHVTAVLNATREMVAHVRQLRANTALGSADPESYIQLLLQKTQEQAIALDRLRRAADERDALDEECSENETKIRALRKALEDAGAPIPEAPHMHRTKRLISRASVSASSSTTLGRGYGEVIGHRRPRLITVPIGTLRAIAQRAGHATIRDLARSHGVNQLAVHVADRVNELHCEGSATALDSFHLAVQHALDSDEARRYTDGILTGSDPASLLAADTAVHNLGEVLPVAPDRLSPSRVRFDSNTVDVDTLSEWGGSTT
jgi:hypothetical protein